MRAEGMHHAWTRLFITLLISWLPWAVATPYIARLGRQYPHRRLRPSLAWIIHLTACASIGLLASAWNASFEWLLNPWAVSPDPNSFFPLLLSSFNHGLVSFLILYAAILAFSYLLDSSQSLAQQQIEAAQLNEQLCKAQLNALQRQIEPHFLFNSLNAIAGLIREHHSDAALDMIVGLSEFLREVVRDSSKQQVPLAEEMQFVQKYLDIQKMRFAERLQVSIVIPKELFPAQVPRLILQPMVENAFKHGIAKRVQGGGIRIAAFHSRDTLTLSVYNDGPKLPPDSRSATEGVGLSNLRTRLKNLYGDAFELSLRNQEPGGVEVSVSMPFRPA
ncbi:MAG: histidine kinase [Acidobacteriaceae bacterium]|nr:histidine kinase [Acidobacteriaceae bacterium]